MVGGFFENVFLGHVGVETEVEAVAQHGVVVNAVLVVALAPEDVFVVEPGGEIRTLRVCK